MNVDLNQLVARKAVKADLPALLALIADDVLGKNRDANPSDPIYIEAFDRIDRDANQYLCVVEYGTRIVGMAQITFIPGLSRRGATRANIEAVRVASDLRGRGVGAWLMRECARIATARGCTLAQLTSDAQRIDAHRFYQRLGYADTHIGFKMALGVSS